MLGALSVALALLVAGGDPPAAPFNPDAVVAQALEGGAARDAAWLIAALDEVDRSHGRASAVHTLSELLGHDDLSVDLQAAAAHCVGKFGTDAGPLVPKLLVLSNEWDYADDSANTVNAALLRLGLGELPQLVAAAGVRPGESDAFWDASSLLRSWGSAARSAVPLLVAALDDDDRAVHWYAAHLLGDIGPPAEEGVPALLAMLQTATNEPGVVEQGFSGADLQSAAASALGEIGAQPNVVVPALIAAMQDSEELRDDAGLALGRMGAAAKGAVPHLIAALADEPPSTFPRLGCLNCGIAPDHWAATALVNIGPDSIPALTEALRSDNAAVRRHAADALWYFGPQAREAAAGLLALLDDEETGVREKAIRALWDVGAEPADVVPGIANSLGDPSPTVRTYAAGALERFGAAAQEALPILMIARHDRDPAVRSAALGALAAIDGEVATTALVEGLRDPVLEVRQSAARQLGELPASAASVAGLIAALGDSDRAVRFSVVGALHGLGPAASDAVPALRELRQREGKSLSRQIDAALQRIEGAERDAVH